MLSPDKVEEIEFLYCLIIRLSVCLEPYLSICQILCILGQYPISFVKITPQCLNNCLRLSLHRQLKCKFYMSLDMRFPTYTYAQSDQRLCSTLENFISVELLTEHHLNKLL